MSALILGMSYDHPYPMLDPESKEGMKLYLLFRARTGIDVQQYRNNIARAAACVGPGGSYTEAVHFCSAIVNIMPPTSRVAVIGNVLASIFQADLPLIWKRPYPGRCEFTFLPGFMDTWWKNPVHQVAAEIWAEELYLDTILAPHNGNTV